MTKICEEKKETLFEKNHDKLSKINVTKLITQCYKVYIKDHIGSKKIIKLSEKISITSHYFEFLLKSYLDELASEDEIKLYKKIKRERFIERSPEQYDKSKLIYNLFITIEDDEIYKEEFKKFVFENKVNSATYSTLFNTYIREYATEEEVLKYNEILEKRKDITEILALAKVMLDLIKNKIQINGELIEYDIVHHFMITKRTPQYIFEKVRYSLPFEESRLLSDIACNNKTNVILKYDEESKCKKIFTVNGEEVIHTSNEHEIVKKYIEEYLGVKLYTKLFSVASTKLANKTLYNVNKEDLQKIFIKKS